MERWCWVNFQCRGVLIIWIKVGQGPTALAVGAGGVVWTFFFSHLSFLVSFSLSLGDGPIYTDILLSRRAVKPKTTNQLLLFYSSTWYICDFFLFHIEIEGKGGWIIGEGGGGGKGYVGPTSQIIPPLFLHLCAQ